MTNDNILKTAHIHLEQASFRVHVENAHEINYERLEETKPAFVHDVGKSNDPEQKKQSFLVWTGADYDLEEMAEWIQNNK